MKKILLLLTIIIVFALSACANPIFIKKATSEAPTQSVAPSPASTPTAAPSPSPAKTAAVPPSPSVTPAPTPSPVPTISDLPGTVDFYEDTPDDLVIIADYEGTILYGYAHGEWITHSEATKYFKKDMTFYQYNLNELVRTLTSTDLIESTSWYNESGLSFNEENDYGTIYAMQFVGNPEVIYGTIITNVSPDKLPKTTAVQNLKGVKSRVKSYLDYKFGTNVPEVKIISAITVDLDFDGENEILVNATNYEDFYEREVGEPHYSLKFVIKPDNTVYVLQEDACIETYDDDDDDEINHGWVYLVCDLNSDGRCEIIWDEYGYEYGSIDVYTYNGYYSDLILYIGANS